MTHRKFSGRANLQPVIEGEGADAEELRAQGLREIQRVIF
jgi:hypothetical protein